MDVDGGMDETLRRVYVRFVTKLEPPYKVPTASIAIPSILKRGGLSEVVNNLLKCGDDDWKTEPFDFLIDGNLLRIPLEEFLIDNRISAEKVLEIEYIKALKPPKEEDPSFHDDWVSAVDGSNPRFVLTGCYDGFGRIWKHAGFCTHILEGHNAALTSVRVVNHKSSENGSDVLVVTASKDRTLRLWNFDAEETSDQAIKIRASKVFQGHKSSIQSVAVQSSGDMVCTGSWDSTINLWRTNDIDAEGDLVSTKRRKKNDQQEDPQLVCGPGSSLVGHTQCVSSVVWPEKGTIYSASWDRSIRRWDVEEGKDLLNMFCGKVIKCLDVGGDSSALIAAGCSDSILRVWDPRRPGTSSPVFEISLHSSWISGCKWHTDSWFHLASSSYDGKVMLWDLRTVLPLASIDSHKDKVLCVDWWKGNSVVSGGADSKLLIHSGVHVH